LENILNLIENSSTPLENILNLIENILSFCRTFLKKVLFAKLV